jgi:hypothetical protein
VKDFTLSNFVDGCAQLFEDRLKAVQSIVGNVGDDEPEPERAQVILGFQIAINRYEYVKPILSEAEQCAVFAGTPASLGYGLHSVTREGSSQAGGNALV